MSTPLSQPAAASSSATHVTTKIAAKSDNNLVWLDMEMTGLSPENDRIIEVAMVVTDSELNVLAEGPVLVIHQPDEILDGMDAWNKGTHGRSGLIDKVKASTTTEAQAEADLLDFLKKWVPKSKSPMCGNSICQDRRFMARYMPKLEAYFHYRNLDVSTLKEAANVGSRPSPRASSSASSTPRTPISSNRSKSCATTASTSFATCRRRRKPKRWPPRSRRKPQTCSGLARTACLGRQALTTLSCVSM